jgi:hypothetical protein
MDTDKEPAALQEDLRKIWIVLRMMPDWLEIMNELLRQGLPAREASNIL